ncbi:MAG TPA: alpha/beta hydrolase [Phenylobacterium sp.]|uniref:alpha/beta hydrolase n=1 Tax=Phenylobacterium sp. TaxID=1871053 RepID=UPI002D24597E|nr:alpha/beta hydrolase [Phenylobacterium sp.]HZZ68298.1 alpha/beta hydrolase [Phenylobacterium sp.]
MAVAAGLSLGAGRAAAIAAPATAQQVAAKPPKPNSRAEATAIIANARKILTPNGVERLEAVRIGGIEQWVSVRGADRRNPVLLHIHGGPGYISIPMSWWFSRGWEEYFTVVQWDQRAAGKTQLINDPATIAPTLTFERMVADAEEMVGWARQTLGKEKIFVTGHSWGSYLGLQLAQRHPDWLHAYIGVGQITDFPESERRGWRFAMDAARREGNAAAIRDLESIAPYSPPGQIVPLKDIYTQRRWVEFYGGTMAYRHGNQAEGDLADLSPDYTDAEIGRIWEGNAFGERYLLQKLLSLDLSQVRTLKCPLIVFAGRHDMNVNADLAAQWFATVTAPAKHLVWFEHSAHLPMTEERGKYLVSLLRYARPLAERAGDGGEA